MYRHRVLTRLVALLMALAMLPGWGEVFETAEHVIVYKHFPHSAAHELHANDEAPVSEPGDIGCNPLFHVCGAKAVKAIVSRSEDLPAPRLFVIRSTDRVLVGETRPPEDLSLPPPTPPPIG